MLQGDKDLNKRWIGGFVNWIERMVKQKRIAIYTTALVLLIASIIGIYQIKISGSLIEDMPKKTEFFEDIRFFENEFKLRLRYFLAVNIALNNKELTNNTFYLSAYNEIFVNAKQNYFDRNRLYGGIGYKFSKKIKYKKEMRKSHTTIFPDSPNFNSYIENQK